MMVNESRKNPFLSNSCASLQENHEDFTVSAFSEISHFLKSLHKNISVGLFKVSKPGWNDIKGDRDIQS